MSSHSVPVLVSRYGDQLHTAVVVDGPEVSASGATSSEAFNRVRDRLKKMARRDEFDVWPINHSHEVLTKTVSVHLFYEHQGRRYPATREIRFPVRYVLSRHGQDAVECFFPEFESIMFCPVPSELDRMIDEEVRARAAQMSSFQLSSACVPDECGIRLVHVTVKPRKHDETPDPPPALSAVAEPMWGRSRNRSSGSNQSSQLIASSSLTRTMDQHSLSTEAERSSVLLVGEPGCGKTTILKMAAINLQRVANENAKENNSVAPISVMWQTSAESLIAGMAYLGQWEERVEAVIADCQTVSATLAVGSLIDLVRLGGSGPADSIAAFLMPYLRRGEVRLAGEATDDELLAIRRLLPGFVDCFEIRRVKPYATDEVASLVEKIFVNAKRNHGLEFETRAPKLVASLMSRFTPYEAPPRAAVELTNDLMTKLLQEGAEKVDASDIIDAIMTRTGIPEVVLRDEVPLSIDDVRSDLSKSVIGQEHAVDIAAAVVLRVKAGLCDPDRPIATMMFSGPTGVGKTQLARSLADYLFGAQPDLSERERVQTSRMIRLDMSEYGNYDGVHRLTIGNDGEVADWIARLRNQPLSVLLLDEFEKASPEVHDVWLSAMDEGRLTDRFGRTTSLCGSIIILTSNVGAARKSPVGFANDNPDQAIAGIDHAIRNAFRPEFLNRLDEIVTFHPISPTTARQIVVKELESLCQRETLRYHRVRLQWNEATVNELVRIGFDSQFGARPLQRAIEQTIVPVIARALLKTAKSPNDQSTVLKLDGLCLRGESVISGDVNA